MATSVPARPPRLPSELVSLVSSVELSQSNWWRRAISQAVLSVLWVASRPLSVAAVTSSLEQDYAIKVTIDEVREQLAQLEADGSVLDLGGDAYKISEARALSLIAGIERGENEEAEAAQTFRTIAEAVAPGCDAETAWLVFNEKLLVPLIYDLGANTYAFLQGTPFALNGSPLLDDYLAAFDPAEQEAARVIASQFLDPARTPARSYVVNRLATYFFVQATTWPRSTIERLAQTTQQKPSFVVFVDTNLLFSLLDLHENPANEAAVALEALEGDLKGLVDFRLYITNETIHEARESLTRTAAGMEGVVLTPQMRLAANTIPFSGLKKRFIEQAGRTDGIRSAQEYFGYYAENLLTVARLHGIELYNQDLTPYHVKQSVIDDILAQSEVQGKARAKRGLPEKSYEQIRHDVVLWHCVRDKREVYVESPLAAKYWIVTVDFAFLGFDAMKARVSSDLVPLCLHPTTLVQMLAFWLPRGENLDSAIVRTLRIPLLFFEYDADLERATVRILQTLNRFANSDRLSTDAITALLSSDALRTRMLAARGEKEMAQLIESEVIEQEEELRRQLKAEQDRATALQASANSRESEIARLAARIDQADLEAASAIAEANRASLDRSAAEERAVRAEKHATTVRLALFSIAASALAILPVAGAVVLLWASVPPGFRLMTVVFGILLWPGLSAGMVLIVVSRWGSAAERDATTRLRGFVVWYFTLVVLGFALNALAGVVAT